MKKQASSIKDLIASTFGAAIRIGPDLIEDDPRWPIPPLDLIEAMTWIGGPFKRAPLVVRRLDGDKYAPVSPIRSFAAHKVLIEAGEEDAFMVRVCEGLSAEEALAVHNAVEWYVSPDHTGDWMHRQAGVYAGLESSKGKPWLVDGPWRFMAASCGTSTVMLTRVQRVAHDAVPEVIALVEEGLFSIRAADKAAKLSQEKQRSIAKAVRDEGITDSRLAARVIRRFEPRKARPVPELVLDLETLVEAVGDGKVSVGVQEALRLQAAAGDLVRAACLR